MSLLDWDEARAGVGRSVTVPLTVGPDEAARDLAPHLRALEGEWALASSTNEAVPAGVPVVTIDGYSGSGKSTLAAALARLVNGWQVLHLDDWYPGWDASRPEPTSRVELPPTCGEDVPPPTRPGIGRMAQPGRRSPSPLAPTIIEGCGAIEAEADLAIWIADPGEEERRHRALARDGQTYAPHWQRWASQDLGRSLK